MARVEDAPDVAALVDHIPIICPHVPETRLLAWRRISGPLIGSVGIGVRHPGCSVQRHPREAREHSRCPRISLFPREQNRFSSHHDRRVLPQIGNAE